MFKGELGPRQWCTHRWTGLEDCIDFVIFYIFCHGILDDALVIIWTSHQVPMQVNVAPADMTAEDKEFDCDAEVLEECSMPWNTN